jgi:hypothetical protein
MLQLSGLDQRINNLLIVEAVINFPFDVLLNYWIFYMSLGVNLEPIYYFSQEIQNSL